MPDGNCGLDPSGPEVIVATENVSPSEGNHNGVYDAAGW